VQRVASEAKGNSAFATSFASMSLILWGGAISSCAYCAVQLTRNKTWGRLVGTGIGRTLLIATSMAILHDAAILLLGLGAGRIGGLWISVGYASFMSFAIIVGNLHGFLTGEWKGASPRAIGWIVAGIAVLIGGVCVLAWGNTLK
jgi:L-rhamnose-H+ transport protein